MSNASADQTPSLRAAVQPTTVRLGDIITLQVEARHAPGQPVVPLLQKNLGTFEVLASTELAPQPGTADIQRFQIGLQNFTTGQQLLPGIGFRYRDADHHPHLLTTPEFKVMVEVVPPGPKDKGGDIRGIKGVLGPVGMSPMWWWLLVFVGVVIGVCLWRNRRQAHVNPPPPPAVPADETALEKLQQLLASGWLENGKVKEFYIALSDIIRGYIEDGFKVPALERTTSELLRDIRKKSVVSSDALLRLKQVLDEGDLVKFAKFRPDAGEAIKTHALAVQFVEQTCTLWREKEEGR